MLRRLLLASRGIPDLRVQLQARGGRALLVPTAANPLAEPGIAEEVERELTDAGLSVQRLDLDAETEGSVRTALAAADVIAVSGGDPFHLLAASHRVAFGDAVAAVLSAGAVYVGYSAGAILAGPTLEPLRLTSPFAPPRDLPLAGLSLADVLVLPHDNRRGRAVRNAAAQATFGDSVRIVRLCDGEFVIQDGDDVELHLSTHRGI